jgi:hypothetical protein
MIFSHQGIEFIKNYEPDASDRAIAKIRDKNEMINVIIEFL